ncbi:hypothetical protein E2I00_015102, partial [Balaenoptera physalus]
RRIEPWEFEVSFDPRELCKEACLLYEIKWGKRQKVWRHSGKNTTKHVECNFIEKITSERHFPPSVSCCITWFLSWSPCWECSKAIREFLNQHPRVTLVIYVARLFQHMDPQNRQGLRDLIHSGVTIQIMGPPEYDYCWRNFVNYPPGKEAHWPRYPPLWMRLYALELHCIILVRSSSLFKDFKKMSESADLVQTYSSKLPLPNDSTPYPFGYRADTTSCDLEMNRMISCVYTVS